MFSTELSEQRTGSPSKALAKMDLELAICSSAQASQAAFILLYNHKSRKLSIDTTIIKTTVFRILDYKQATSSIMTPITPVSPMSSWTSQTPQSATSSASTDKSQSMAWTPCVATVQPVETRTGSILDQSADKQQSTNQSSTNTHMMPNSSHTTTQVARGIAYTTLCTREKTRIGRPDSILNNTPKAITSLSTRNDQNHMDTPNTSDISRSNSIRRTSKPWKNCSISSSLSVNTNISQPLANHSRQRKQSIQTTKSITSTITKTSSLSTPQCKQNRSQHRTRSTSPKPSTNKNRSLAKPRSSTPKVKLTIKPSYTKPPSSNPALANSISHLRTPLIPLISVTTGLPHPDFPRSLLQYHLLTHSQLDSLARWYHQTHDAGRERRMYPAIIKKTWCYNDDDSSSSSSSSDNTSTTEDEETHQTDLGTKRRRFGAFIGLRGCASPVSVSLNDDLSTTISTSNDIKSCNSGSDDNITDSIIKIVDDKDEERTTKKNPNKRGYEETETPISEQQRLLLLGNDDGIKDEDEKWENVTERMERKWRDALRRAEEERLLREKIWRGRF